MYLKLHSIALPTPDAKPLLAAGFCERWAKAWRGGFALVLGQLLIMAKKLAANVSGVYAVKKWAYR